MKKRAIEVLLVRSELTGLPEKRILRSRHLGSVDLVWPQTGIAKKSAARQMVFKRGLAAAVTDPVGATSGDFRDLRGGYWYDYAIICRSAFRYYLNPSNESRDRGFRLACSAGSSK